MTARPHAAPRIDPAGSASVTRADAADPARERLLDVGLQLFAEQGFAKTSVRQIALAAGTNVAAVSYYFGSKAGLYDAAAGCCDGESTRLGPPMPLDGLDDLFTRMLAPLRSGGRGRFRLKLLRREMLEPSGLWNGQLDRGLRPMHDALVGLLCDRLGVEAPDDEVQALAMLVVAPALHLLLNCELIDALAPRLLSDDAAVDAWCGRLCRHAELLIADESRARSASAPPRPSRSPA